MSSIASGTREQLGIMAVWMRKLALVSRKLSDDADILRTVLGSETTCTVVDEEDDHDEDSSGGDVSSDCSEDDSDV